MPIKTGAAIDVQRRMFQLLIINLIVYPHNHGLRGLVDSGNRCEACLGYSLTNPVLADHVNGGSRFEFALQIGGRGQGRGQNIFGVDGDAQPLKFLFVLSHSPAGIVCGSDKGQPAAIEEFKKGGQTGQGRIPSPQDAVHIDDKGLDLAYILFSLHFAAARHQPAHRCR